MGEGLEWLASVLWNAPDVRVTLGERAPPGFRIAERYAVVPSAARARFLIPMDDRRAAAASMAAYNALRPAKVRLSRAAIAAGLRAGAAGHLLRDRLAVCVPAEAGDDDAARWLLCGRLREIFDEPSVHAAIGIGRRGPFRKPVLQAFRPDGAVLGYVKAGWNDVTRALVRAEAEMLGACERRRPSRMVVPGLAAAGPWRGLETVVAAPLPAGLRRYRPRTRVPSLDATREVADLFGRRVEPLAAGEYWSRARSRVDAIAPAVDTDVADALRSYAAWIERRHGDVELTFGAWHGDWAPWNMARLDGRLVVWDWEHGRPGVPLGFDPLHFHFQLAFIADEDPLQRALVRTRERAAAPLSDLELTAAQAAATTDLHLLEVFLRYQEAMLAGAGRNPRFFPSAVGVLRERSA
jgi:hypothetical protein